MSCSLRARLLAGVTGGMALLLVVFSVVIYASMRRTLTGQFDSSLASTAALLAASVEIDRGQVEMELDVSGGGGFGAGQFAGYYQLWRSDGSTAFKSAMSEAIELMPTEGTLEQPDYYELELGGGRAGRAVCMSFMVTEAVADGSESGEGAESEQSGGAGVPVEAASEMLTLAVARDASELRYTLASLRWLLLVACVGVMGLSLLAAWVVVGRGLRPLNSIAGEIGAVSDGNLGARIGTSRMPAELIPIRERLNDLLGRLEASFNRERRFTADVAHELRTPLAGLRSTIEVALLRTRAPAEYEGALSDCLRIAASMQAMVDHLLALARLEGEHTGLRREKVDAAEVAASCRLVFSGRAREKGLRFESDVPAGVTVASDWDSLSMVLTNVFENAVEYCDEGGLIRVEGRRLGDRAEIVVTNTGCRLTAEQAGQVFDCFWRGDASRTDTGNHCGLGLALVKRIVASLGGQVSAKVEDGGVFRVRIVLPAE